MTEALVSATCSMNGMTLAAMDGSGTINPAALESSASLFDNVPDVVADSSPRGVKRSRSPDGTSDAAGPDGADDDDSKPRKRGRQPKPTDAESPPVTKSSPVQTPQLETKSLPQEKDPATSPPQKASQTTPTSKQLKALPTVRDHTTDQLNPEGDEYIPREWDEAGDKKAAPTGHLMEGREYRCRTFFVPNRGDKLFMLATECARVLNYRDSYLLFNKNRSLCKIIATQPEKDDLIHQDILPYSYRSRQIAIVTARSMFRQFGSRIIVNGRRVRDDYWEAKARKQGFTEDDPAGEKRPGAQKQRDEAAASASTTNVNAMNTLAHGEVIYRNGPSPFGNAVHANSLGIGGIAPANLAPLPMINLAPSDDMRARDYGNVPRPRHDISGTPYQDRTQPSAPTEIVSHAAQSAEYNKLLTQQRLNRGQYYQDQWKRDHPPTRSPTQSGADNEEVVPLSQNFQSPPQRRHGMTAGGQQPMMPQHQQQMMNSQAFAQQQHHQNQMAQSPMRGDMHQQIRPDQIHNRASSMNYGPAATQSPQYTFPHNQMWPPPQPQSSPHPQQQMQQFGHHPQQHSPVPNQSPHHMPLQIPPQASSGSMQGNPMFQGMGMAPGYQNIGRAVFQGSPSPHQNFMHQSAAGQQTGMQGWAPPNNPGQGQPGWHGF